jgi:NAD(P)H-hydrate epimerase
MKISTVQEMRALDAQAMSEYGMPDYLLMENAGEAAYYVILRELGVTGSRFVVVSGPGNNGGDGFVVGRKLHSSGGQVRVLLFSDPASYSGPAKGNLEILEKSGVELLVHPDADDVSTCLEWCDAVVDGLLGTGIRGEVDGRFREIVQQINGSEKPVFSLDIPSGVDGDTGQVRGVAVHASRTITFGLPKRGNFLGPGAGFGGDLFVSHISFPPKLIANAGIKVEINRPAMLPATEGDAHNKSFRDVLFVAGAENPVDSTAFGSMALVEIVGRPARFAIPRSLMSAVESFAGKILLVPQDETDTGTLALGCLEELLRLGHDANLVILGPGLSPSEETRELTRRFCEELERPLLLNGNALSEGAENVAVISRRSGPTIWLLQTSEMSRIFTGSMANILKDPLGCVQTLSEETGALVALRARPALIGFPNGGVFVDLTDRFFESPSGRCNVLPGLIGAMCRLGLSLEEAVRTGVFLRGLAGDLAVQREGEVRPSARQIVQALPGAIKALREDHSGVTAHLHGNIAVV